MTTAVILTAAGLLLLAGAADRFVLAAVRLSRALGLSPILIGALLVGFGTSLPEVFVSVLAAMRGDLDLAVGNVVGSNIANLTLVLGTAVLLRPIVRQREILRREGVLMLASLVALTAVLLNLTFARWEGLVLLVGMGVAGYLLVRWASQDAAREPSFAGEGELPARGWAGLVAVRLELVVGVVALGLTLLGADLLVRGAERLAMALDLPEAFIGLTVVAIGTSLPELATSVAATRRGEGQLVVGNVLGSNLFNSLLVAGSAGVAGGGPIDPGFRAPLLYMVGVAVVAGFLAYTGRDKLARAEGLLLLAGFAGFLVLSR